MQAWLEGREGRGGDRNGCCGTASHRASNPPPFSPLFLCSCMPFSLSPCWQCDETQNNINVYRVPPGVSLPFPHHSPPPPATPLAAPARAVLAASWQLRARLLISLPGIPGCTWVKCPATASKRQKCHHNCCGCNYNAHIDTPTLTNPHLHAHTGSKRRRKQSLLATSKQILNAALHCTKLNREMYETTYILGKQTFCFIDEPTYCKLIKGYLIYLKNV